VLADQAQLEQTVAVFLLLLARMTPVALLVPWLTPRAGAPVLGLVLSVTLAVALLPTALAGAPALPTSALSLSAFALRESLLGAVYALSLALPLFALRWAGHFVERARGDSPLQTEGGALSELMLWLGIVAFFAIGGHRVAIAALAESLTAHPVGVLEALGDPAALALGSARLLAEALAAALLVALPALAALLFVELALALSIRLSGALPLAAALPAGRAALGVGVVWVSAGWLLYHLPAALSDSLAAAGRLWQAI